MQIPLTNDPRFLIVDDSDKELVSAWKWRAVNKGRRTYAVSTSDYKIAHRIILDAPRGLEVDHRNGDGLDCRRQNIRLATKKENQHNRTSTAGSTSQYLGVSWDSERQRWAVQISIDGRSRRIGRYLNEEDAARAWDFAAKEIYGDWPRLNFPE